jgi:hypothetical protein
MHTPLNDAKRAHHQRKENKLWENKRHINFDKFIFREQISILTFKSMNLSFLSFKIKNKIFLY